jgi:ribosomal protein L37AE/L43A
MKWLVKKVGNKWARRCPYCLTLTAHDTEPSNNWVCQKCKAIVNPETYQVLQKCAKAFSKIFSGE